MNERFGAKVSGNMKYALLMMKMKIMIGMVAARGNSRGLIISQLLGDGDGHRLKMTIANGYDG